MKSAKNPDGGCIKSRMKSVIVKYNRILLFDSLNPLRNRKIERKINGIASVKGVANHTPSKLTLLGSDAKNNIENKDVK